VRTAPLAALLLLAALPACASYSGLARERDAWQPRRVYVDPPEGRTPPAQAPAPSLDAVFSTAHGKYLLGAPSSFAPAGTVPFPPRTPDYLGPDWPFREWFDLATLQSFVRSLAPAVEAEAWKARAALQGYSQARALEETLRSYAAFSDEGREPALLHPAPSPAALRAAIVETEVWQARASYESIVRDAQVLGARLFWELAFNRAAQRATAETVRRLDQLAASAAARYQAGGGEFAEMAEGEAARKLAAVELETLKNGQKTLEEKIRALVGMPAEAALGEPRAADPPTDDPGLPALERSALDHSPELTRMRAEADKMELMLQMGRRENYPGYSLNLSLTDSRFLAQAGTAATERSFPDGPAVAGMRGRPLGAGYGIEAAYLQELSLLLTSLKIEIRATELKATTAVREAWTAFDRARREHALYLRDIEPLARLSTDSALSGFSAGNVTFAGAAAALNRWFETTLARERKRSDLGIARAELIAAAGGPWSSAKETQP
jgi:outer membrane protein TolC